MTAAGGAGAEALVVRVSGPTATLRIDGAARAPRLPPRLAGRPVVAGDRVGVRGEGAELAVERIGPRATRLDRAQGPGRRPRPIVANADLLVIVGSAAEPPIHPRLVDRYLVAGHAGGLDAALCVTKVDLPHEEARLASVLDVYREAGYPVLAGDAGAPGLPGALRELIGARVAVLAGPSGVGKSTLARAMTGVDRAVGEVSRKAGTGRHTTTDPRLIPLPGGGAVVDTAGVREFHLPPMEPADVAAGFPEIAAAAAQCRFAGCAHDRDAGCAVVDRVPAERLESYRRIVAETRAEAGSGGRRAS